MAARSHRARGRRPQALDVGLEREDGQGGAVPVDEGERVRVRHGALGRAELHRRCSRRDGDEVRADGLGSAESDFDAHRLPR